MSKLSPVSIGVSSSAEALTAGQAAAHMAIKRLPGRQIQGALVFGSSWFHQARLLEGIRSVLGPVPLVGGSTAGEITPDGPKSHSCVVVALADETMSVGVGLGADVTRNPRLAGYSAAHQAIQQFNGHPRSGFVIFADGLSTGYAEVLRGIQEVLGTGSLVTGALMADDLRFVRTYQYAADRPVSQAVVGLLLGGAWKLGVGLEHGFAPISKPRRITRARATILYELDGQPASAVYEEYFGSSIVETIRRAGFSRQLIAYPLGIQLEMPGQFLLRNIIACADDGSLVCTGEMTEGSWVQLMIGSKELALNAARLAAERAIQHLQTVHFVLVFDSVARKQLLGHEAAQELHILRQTIGPSVPLAGCYTYGEQAPLGSPYSYGRSSVQTGAILVIAVGQ